LPRYLDLDRDLLAGLEFRAMYLRQRCGRQRLAVKLGEDVVGQPAGFSGDDALYFTVRDARHVVLQSR
jgi:hypothetical protein